MSKLVFANRDYGPAVNGWGAHMTSEGMELQLGLKAAGWTLVGAGYGDGCRDVPFLLDRYKPEVVLVADRRDWDPNSAGAFRKDIGFIGLAELSKHPEIFKMAVVKDAGGQQDYHRHFCEEIAADAILTYYHDQSVLSLNPWMAGYETIRTYHSIDATLNPPMLHKRRRGVVSGAMSAVYPLRTRTALHRATLGIDLLKHPGYSNRGCSTPQYMEQLAGYRVHVATASKFGFCLRKIVESVAVGTTPVTNLPPYDNLPLIDKALVRIADDASIKEIKEAIDYADRSWNFQERSQYADLARSFYDFRATGILLDFEIDTARKRRMAHV